MLIVDISDDGRIKRLVRVELRIEMSASLKKTVSPSGSYKPAAVESQSCSPALIVSSIA